MGAAAVMAVGGPAAEAETDAPPHEDRTQSRPVQVRRGGVLRLTTTTGDHNSFDPHRTHNESTEFWMGFYMNQLVRWRNREHGIMESDIASLPEMPDDSTYVFRLNQGARFWDQFPTEGGRLVTSDDIRMNVERHLDHEEPLGTPWAALPGLRAFGETASIDTPDQRTFIAITNGPNATYLHKSFLSPLGRITSPEAMSAFANRWSEEPDNISLSSGTGMYIPRGYDARRGLLLTRNDHFWKLGIDNQALPYPDAVILYRNIHLGVEEAWYRDGFVSMCGRFFPHTLADQILADFPDHQSAPVAHGHTVDMAFNFNEANDGTDGLGNPWVDRRVAYAFHLATDRRQLMDAIYFGNAEVSATAGAPWFSRAWTVPPEELATWPGYRPNRDEDLNMANDLLDASGVDRPNRTFYWITPDVWEQTYPGISEAMKSMYEQALDIRVQIDARPYQEINWRTVDGTVPARTPAWTHPPSDLDPTDWWNVAYVEGGSANLLHYNYPPAEELITGMKTELNMERRQETARELLRMFLGVHPQHGLEAMTPRPAVMNGFWRQLSWPYVHNSEDVYQFAHASHRYDDTWLDTTHPEYSA